MPSFARIMESAREFKAGFVPDQHSAAPERHLVVVTCMDARLDLFRLLGLEIGDSHILRNAGGRVTDDVMRSLVLSSNVLGTTEVIVIHHTGCGLFGRENDELRAEIAAMTGADTAHLEFHPFDDVVESVRGDVAAIAASPLLQKVTRVWGAVYDVATGELSPVDRTH